MSEPISIEISTPTNTYTESNVRGTNYLTCPNSLVKESLFEFFGMYLFITLSLGNVALTNLYPEASANWTGVSISWGLNLMFGIYLASFKSPAHLNPAVSLCMFLFKQTITFKQLIWYTVSQFLGAFVAAATVYGIYYNKLGSEDKYSNIFTTSANYAITDYTAWFTEFLGTALLVGGIFMLVDHKSTKNHVPIYAGLWLSTLVFSFGFQTAFAWNPARDLGPRVFAACAGYASFSYTDYYFWVPLTADYLGALFGVAFYEYLIKPNTN
jgi:MIP family channel proteins